MHRGTSAQPDRIHSPGMALGTGSYWKDIFLLSLQKVSPELGVTDKASINGEWKPNALRGLLSFPKFLSKIFLQPLSPPPTPPPSTNMHPAPLKDQPFCRERERLGKPRTSSKPDWKYYLLVQRGQRNPGRPILAAARINPSRSVVQRRPSSPQMRTLTLGGGQG